MADTEQKFNFMTFIKKHKWKLLALAIIAIIMMSLIIVLIAIRPNIPLSSMEVEVPEQEIERIAMDSEYPQLSFSTPHLVELPNGQKLDYVETYQTTADDFVEGANTIKFWKQQNLLLVDLIAETPGEWGIEVDRVAPELEIEHENEGKFLLLEDTVVSVISEPQVTIFVGDDELATLDSAEEQLAIPTQDGETKLELFAVDKFGNRSQTRNLTYTSFNRDGFERKECGALAFPFANQLRIGINDFADDAKPNIATIYGNTENAIAEMNAGYECNTGALNIQVFLKSDAEALCIPCGGPGIFSPNFRMYTTDKSVADYLEQRINPSSRGYVESVIGEQSVDIKKDETFNSRSGVEVREVRYTETDTISPYGGTYDYIYYLWRIGDTTYVIETSTFSNTSPKIQDYAKQIAMNFKGL